MHRVRGHEWSRRILLPGFLRPCREPERQRESGGSIGPPSVSIAGVEALTEGSSKCDGREWHPPRARLELLWCPGGTEPRDSRNRRGAPRLTRFEVGEGDRAARDQCVVTDAARPQGCRQPPTQTVIPFRDKEAQQLVAAILAPAVHAVVARGGAMPARARHLERCAHTSSGRHVIGLDPDIARPERRGGVARRAGADAGPVGK